MPENRPRLTVGHFSKSVVFTVGVQWVIRIIGFLSITILARLLTPEDFGLVYLALSVFALARVTTFVGVRNALIRETEIDDVDYNTAWTIGLIVNLAIGFILATAIAPVAADYFDRPEVAFIIQVLSLTFVFTAFQNIRIVDFERNLTFKKDFYLRCSARIFSFVLVIGTALYFRSYWALVIGAISRAAGLTIFSYIFLPYKPRLCLERWRKFTNYSIWMLIDAVAQNLHNQIERIALGRTADNFILGLYIVSHQVSRIFTFEIAMGISRVAFPSFSRLQDQPQRFKQGILSGFGAYALIITPLALGMSATSENFIPILLGEQWRESTPLFSVLAIGVGLQALSNPFRPILLAAGMQRFMALTRMGFAAVLAVIVFVAVTLTDPLGLAKTVLVTQLVFFFGYLVIVAVRFDVSMVRLIVEIGRPCLAGGAMYTAVVWLPVSIAWPAYAVLAAQVVTGAVVYAVAVLAIWYASGKPEGAEQKILEEIVSRLKKF